MRKTILGAITLALVSLASPLVSPATAVEYPWCAMGTSTCAEACDFSTLAQCRAFLLGGNKGTCVNNPRYSPRAEALISTPRPRR
jgi:hypothetical protein